MNTRPNHHRAAQQGMVRKLDRRHAFSMIEVLVVIAIIAFLIAILAPSLGRARDQMRRVMCRNNLRQWGIALQFYRSDFKDFLPTEGEAVPTPESIQKPYTWFNVLPPYLDAPPYKNVEGAGVYIQEFPALHVWICPAKNLSHLNTSLTHKNQFHYAMNRVLDGTGNSSDGSHITPGFTDPGSRPISANRFLGKPRTVYLFDNYPNSPNGDPATVGDNQGIHGTFHRNSVNVLYVDGGVAHFPNDAFVEDGDFESPQRVWDHPGMYWGWRPPADP